MKKILVVSDNHTRTNTLEKIFLKEKYDYIFHCGDYCISDAKINQMVDFVVKGNNDFSSSNEENIVTTIEKVKIFMTHGDKYSSFRMNYKKILDKIDSDVKLVLFGHLHIPIVHKENNVIFINPGSTDWPRSRDGSTYCLIILNQGKIQNIQHKKV